MQNFLEAEDILICESGLSVAFLSSLLLPKTVAFIIKPFGRLLVGQLLPHLERLWLIPNDELS